ncbi:unnamed protein product [Closterium sp. NIES-65]|nr:unnamed protein product [Closterium sp. NIES-65]
MLSGILEMLSQVIPQVLSQVFPQVVFSSITNASTTQSLPCALLCINFVTTLSPTPLPLQPHPLFPQTLVHLRHLSVWGSSITNASAPLLTFPNSHCPLSVPPPSLPFPPSSRCPLFPPSSNLLPCSLPLFRTSSLPLCPGFPPLLSLISHPASPHFPAVQHQPRRPVQSKLPQEPDEGRGQRQLRRPVQSKLLREPGKRRQHGRSGWG